MPLYTNHCGHHKDEYFGPVYLDGPTTEEDNKLRGCDVYFTFGDAMQMAYYESTDPTERLNPANWEYCARYGNEGHEYSSGSVLSLTASSTHVLFRAWLLHVEMIVEEDHEKARRLSHH